ncbi:MAG: hypothetical protein WC967_09410 [Balneolaceae bacterium]
MKPSVPFYPSASEYFVSLPRGSKIPRGLNKKLQSIVVEKVDAEINSILGCEDHQQTTSLPKMYCFNGIYFYSINNTISLNSENYNMTLFKVNRPVGLPNCFV